jgi:hypothetical protein
MDRLPLGLRQVLESGDCVLFIGAGVGAHLKKPDGKTAPDGSTLAKELIAHFGLPATSTDLAKVAELVEIRKDRNQLDAFLKKTLADVEPDEVFRWLTTFRWRAIFTTNYDRGIERAYDLNPNTPQTPISLSVTAELQQTDPRVQVPIYHLHGSLYGPNPSHIVITQTDYARYKERRRMLWERLKLEFATSTFLYIGYSGRDPNWQLVLDELTQEFLPSELPHSYRLDPFADDIDVEILKSRNLETLRVNLAEFQALVKAEIGDFRQDPDALKKYEKHVPADLQFAFEKSAAALLRFLNSWIYVNAANFHEKSNVDKFLEGDKPSWSLVGESIPFERDIEEEMWENILEFGTNPKAKSKAIALLAPAGFGVTTLLMTLAANVVAAKLGPVFMLRDGAQVLEGDVAFAATLFPGIASFFFVDQAREHAIALNTALLQQRQTDSSCLFVIGERKNEWRLARSRMKVDEYELEPLSDAEIDRLLDYLAKQDALGKLAELERAFQFAIVKGKHEKQLLVALREATEGIGFDAIIENEYRGIFDKDSQESSGLAKDVYLLTACFHQQGIFIRDNLLAEILRRQLTDLYALLGDALEGLVTFEETDVARGEYAARTRHRTIAEIVWKRCGLPATKESLLQSAMEKLNLSYRLDNIIFEKFVRNDEIVETFQTLDGKIRFFETAYKRDPNNPYVLQHFARMLLREKRTSLALAQINAALQMDNKSRVLHHTKGTILADLAISVDNEDVGRKWMQQSEHEFRTCIAMNAADDYSYVGLASLFLEWGKRVVGADEASDYITKSEHTISEGLRVVKQREALLIVSSEVQRWLENEPSRLAKLRMAVTEGGSTAVIPRYLLGRAYRKGGEPAKCIEVLDPIVKSQFGEFRSAIEYVRAMLDLGESFSKCAAVLSLSQLDGVTSPAYVSLLGGLLFMDGKTGEATRVFDESVKQGFSFEERNFLNFRPHDPANPVAPIRLTGRVVTVKPGYVFIQHDTYPDFMSRSTRVRDTILQKGSQVTFEPAFCAKGPNGTRVQLL